MEEFQLLVYYMNHTVETMSNGSDVDVWRKAVPEQAAHHEFLMDGLLALSALHFAFNHLDVRWRYVEFASRYQASALRKYTKALQGVTESNGHALFAYAIITMIPALAFTTIHKDMTSNPIDDSISFFRLLQGVGTVDRMSGVHLKEGPFQALWDLDRSCHVDNYRPEQERCCNIGLDRILSSHLACTRRSSSHRSRHLNALTLDVEASSMLY